MLLYFVYIRNHSEQNKIFQIEGLYFELSPKSFDTLWALARPSGQVPAFFFMENLIEADIPACSYSAKAKTPQRDDSQLPE